MLLIPLLATALSGCAYRMNGDRPAVALPTTLATTGAAAVSIWPDENWWHGFDSPELDHLMAAAKRRNQDLAAAIARVHQAQALVRVARAPLLPTLGISGDATGQSYNNTNGAVSGIYWDGTLTVSYEVDFWGRVSATAAAAQESLRASRYDQETVALTVTATVADSYFQALSARARLAIARDVAQQRALVATQLAAIPPLEQTEIVALSALAVLLDQPPQEFTVSADSLDRLQAPAVEPGPPAELLTRRPDIASAEAQLFAADANVAAARAAMLPSINLTGAAGVQLATLSSVTGGTGFLYTLAAGLVQPIFDNGALAGQRDYAIAQREELIARYRSAIVNAFADVQEALQDLDHLARQQAAQEEVVTQSRRAFDLVSSQYRAGAEDMLTVLDTQRTLYAAQDQFEQIKLARFRALVDLYQALGGGWHQEDPQ